MTTTSTIVDIVVFLLVVFSSGSIGFYFAWKSRGGGNTRDFLTGSRNLNALPVSMSLSASFMSSVTLLSVPTEVYYFGVIFGLTCFAYLFSIIISSELFLPVFYRLNIASTYEYLELRYNKVTRLVGTVLFIIQTVLFTGVVTYAPALALNQVFSLNLWIAITITAIICTLYCTLGGLKAVVWTDVLQIIIMFAGSLSVIIKSVITQGGFSVILSDSQQGGRLNLWDFDVNPMRRHTFWTVVIGGTFGWTSVYGIHQAQIQRYNACKSVTQARLALYLNFFGAAGIMITSVLAGMCAYSVLKSCDPKQAGLISATDQLLPFLVMKVMRDNPGLPGLFFAAIHCGSLSTVSSSISALTAVTIEDLIKPYFRMSETHLAMTSRGLSFFFGILCIGMAGLASIMGSHMVQLVTIIAAVTGGPLLALFGLGILCPFANTKGGLSGLVVGFLLSIWITVAGIIFPPPPEMVRPLPVTTDGCNFTSNDQFNWTSSALPSLLSSPATAPFSSSNSTNAGPWQSPSYLYTCLIGMVTSVIVGLIISLLTGGRINKVRPDLMLVKEDTVMYHLYKYTTTSTRVRKTQYESKATIVTSC